MAKQLCEVKSLAMALMIMAYGVMAVSSSSSSVEIRGRSDAEGDGISWYDGDSTDPWYHVDLPPGPATYYEYLRGCMNTLTKPCARQAFDKIMGKGDVDTYCCAKVREMGSQCAASAATTVGQMEKFKPCANLISQKSREIFTTCQNRTPNA